jgi:hypothetical protein
MSCGRYLEIGILGYKHDTVLHVANCCCTHHTSNELFNYWNGLGYACNYRLNVGELMFMHDAVSGRHIILCIRLQ